MLVSVLLTSSLVYLSWGKPPALGARCSFAVLWSDVVWSTAFVYRPCGSHSPRESVGKGPGNTSQLYSSLHLTKLSQDSLNNLVRQVGIIPILKIGKWSFRCIRTGWWHWRGGTCVAGILQTETWLGAAQWSWPSIQGTWSSGVWVHFSFILHSSSSISSPFIMTKYLLSCILNIVLSEKSKKMEWDVWNDSMGIHF